MILIIAVIIWLSFFLIDYNCAKNNKTPIFCIKFDSYWDGGTKEYLGLGYKIIKYHYFDEEYDEFRRATRYLYFPDKAPNK